MRLPGDETLQRLGSVNPIRNRTESCLRVRDVTRAAHDTTSESDVDLEDVQATRDRAVHVAKQNSASSFAAEPCVRS